MIGKFKNKDLVSVILKNFPFTHFLLYFKTKVIHGFISRLQSQIRKQISWGFLKFFASEHCLNFFSFKLITTRYDSDPDHTRSGSAILITGKLYFTLGKNVDFIHFLDNGSFAYKIRQFLCPLSAWFHFREWLRWWGCRRYQLFHLETG